MSSLQPKTINSVVWSGLERFSAQGVQFITNIVMARMLMPEDYGVMAILVVFLAVFQIFIDSGFSSALVQKHDRSEIDYATVFYFSISISVVMFFVLFCFARLIAEFYQIYMLTFAIRVIGFNLIITAFGIVPRAKFTILLNFKTQAKTSFVGVLLGGAVGIWMAYAGYGVWALISQILLSNGVSTILLWILSKWWPLATFSIVSFKKLFFFGSKLLLSGLLDVIYRNIYTLIIGRKFTTYELGFYSRADHFANFSSANISDIINRVVFPVMCEAQYDDENIKKIFCKILRASTFIIFPLMAGLIALAEPFIRLLLTERWMGIVVFLQILCLSYMWYPVHALNLMLLQAKGRSDLFLRLDIVKKIVGIAILIVTIPLGLTAMCIGLVVYSIVALYVNAFYTKRYLSVGLVQQIKYMLPSLLLSSSMGVIIFLLTQLELSDVITLLVGMSFGCLYYIGIAKALKMRQWQELQIVFSLVGKKA